MKRLRQSTVVVVVLMTFIGCGGGGSTNQSIGPGDDFTALLNQVASPESTRGTNVVAVGGGSVEALFNPSVTTTAKANFSFFAGYDKNGEPIGNFVLKRVFPGDGVRGVKSTEITYVDVGEDIAFSTAIPVNVDADGYTLIIFDDDFRLLSPQAQPDP